MLFRSDGIVERELVLGQPQFSGATIRVLHLAPDLEHRPNHFRRIDKPVVIFLQRLFEQLAEAACLGEIPFLARDDLVRQQLFQEPQPQVWQRLVLERLQELVVEDRCRLRSTIRDPSRGPRS